MLVLVKLPQLLVLFLKVVAFLNNLVNLLLYLSLLLLVAFGLPSLLMQSSLEELNFLRNFLLFADDFLLPVLLVHVVFLCFTDLGLIRVLKVHVTYLSFRIFYGIDHFACDLLLPHQFLLSLDNPCQ